MRGAVIHAPGDVRIEERADPVLKSPGDAIVRLSASCVCGSDLWPYRGINQVREPDLFALYLRSQLAANHVAIERMTKLYGEYSPEVVDSVSFGAAAVCVGFCPSAKVGTTSAARTALALMRNRRGISLSRQRVRWDRDALRIRFMMYGELRFFHRLERLPDTLQRLDFIVFDLVPTLSLPFYLAYMVLLFGAADAVLFLGSVYVLLLWISIFNMALAFVMFNRSIGFFGLSAWLIFPLYQGVYLKCARFFTYSSEILFASSRRDDFVPPRVSRALLGHDPEKCEAVFGKDHAQTGEEATGLIQRT